MINHQRKTKLDGHTHTRARAHAHAHAHTHTIRVVSNQSLPLQDTISCQAGTFQNEILKCTLSQTSCYIVMHALCRLFH